MPGTAQGRGALDAGGLAAALAARGCRVAALELPAEVDSTNAQLLARPVLADPTLMVAERQTAGRGRRGRRWVSRPGGSLTFSIGRRVAASPSRLAGLSLACGVAVAEALAAFGVDVGLKWPNDLLAGGAKLGGLLVESRRDGEGWRVVVGLGLNLELGEAGQGIDQDWTDLHRMLDGAVPGREALLVALVPALLDAIDDCLREGLGPFLPRFAARDLLRGREVSLAGARVPGGLVLGIDEDGCLRVEHEGRVHRLAAGEVSVRA